MLTIRTPKELKSSLEELDELDAQLAVLKKKYKGDAAAYHTVAGGIEEIRRETAQAIDDYQEALQGNLPPVLHTRDPHTGKLNVWRTLVLLRLAARLDQAELARQLATQQSTVSRWESEGYDQYNLRQLLKIADSLGYDVDVAFVRRPGAQAAVKKTPPSRKAAPARKPPRKTGHP